MALLDMVSFEVEAGVSQFVAVEGDSSFNATIETSPAPYPDTESKCLKLDQNSSTRYWKGKVHNISEGDAFLVETYVYFTKAGAVPFTNPVSFLTVTDGTNDHIIVRMKANGAVNDVEVLDAGGSVVATIAGTTMVVDGWYLVRMLFRLHNTAGACILQVVSTLFGDVLGSTSCSGADFWTGTAKVGYRFWGQGGSPPAQPTTTYIGSALLFDDKTFPLDADEFLPGNFTCFGASPTKVSETPDCDNTGTAPGGDVLDSPTTWNLLGDGNYSLGGTYSTQYDNGAVKVDHPADVPAIMRADVVQYGGSWNWRFTSSTSRASLAAIYGREFDGIYTVTNVTVPNGTSVSHHVVQDVTGDRMPSPNAHAVIGFGSIHATATVKCREAWFFGAYAYPLAFGAVSFGGLYTQNSGRLVVG